MAKYERKTSDIFISPRFRRTLEFFKDESVYANLLLKARINKELLVDNHINHFSVSNDDYNRISYLNDKRLDRINQLGDNIWTSRYRYHCKPGGFLNKIFKDVKDTEVEKFASLWRTFSIDVDYEFKIVKGNEIANYYHHTKHKEHSGSLGVSCMKHPQCQDWFSIYRNNEFISMIIMLSPDDKVIGRALLWEQDDVKVMDRIYTIYDEQYQGLFIHWAKKNNYTYKVQQNWGNSVNFMEKGKKVEKRMKIQLEQDSFYPPYAYFDTFKWLNYTTGELYNYCPSFFNRHDTDTFRLLGSPNGVHERSDYLKFDEITRIYGYSGDMIQVDGITTNANNTQYSEVFDVNILRRDAIYREDIKSYVYTDDTRNDQVRIQEREAWFKSRREQRDEEEKRIKKREEERGARRSNRDRATISVGSLDATWDPTYFHTTTRVRRSRVEEVPMDEVPQPSEPIDEVRVTATQTEPTEQWVFDLANEVRDLAGLSPIESPIEDSDSVEEETESDVVEETSRPSSISAFNTYMETASSFYNTAIDRERIDSYLRTGMPRTRLGRD